MTSVLRPLAAVALVGLCAAPNARAQHTAMPAGMTHEEHMAQMKKDVHAFLTYQIAEHKTGDPLPQAAAGVK